jgi:hypothetical protein
MEDDLNKNRKWKMTSKKVKMEDDLKTNNKWEKRKTTQKRRKRKRDDQNKILKKEEDLNKKLFPIPLKLRGKPFLGLAQLSKIVCIYSLYPENDFLYSDISILICLQFSPSSMERFYSIFNRRSLFQKHCCVEVCSVKFSKNY